MFYYEDKDGSFEKLIRDYVSSITDDGKIPGYEIGKGWPSFKLESESEDVKGLHGLEYGFNPGCMGEQQPETATGPGCICESFFERTLEEPGFDISSASAIGGSGYDISLFEAEMHYMKSLAGELIFKIIPAIDEVLNEYDYEGSPIFGDTMTPALLGEIVEKAMQRGALLVKEIREIMVDQRLGVWDRRGLLHNIFELVILKEIFAVRRHHHRQVMGS